MSRPIILIPAYNPNQPFTTKNDQPTMAKVPTASGVSRKRLFAGGRLRPSQPNKKPNFTTQANKKVNLNATRPRNEANINLTTNKKANPTFKQKVDVLASKKADVTTNKKVEVIGRKAEVATNKKVEVISKKAKAVVYNKAKAAPINRANANVFSNFKAKIQSSLTQGVRFEEPKTEDEATSSSESASGSDDDEEANANPFTNMKPKVQIFRTRVANNDEIETDDEGGTSSSDSESESGSESEGGGVPTKKVDAVMFPNVKGKQDSAQNPRTEKLEASSSESGSNVEIVSSNKVNAGNVSKVNVQCTAQQSRGQEVESEDESDSTSSGSGSDSGDDEDGSSGEGSQKSFADEVNSSDDSTIECLHHLSPTPSFAKGPESSLPTVVPTGKAQNSQDSIRIAPSSPATRPFLKGPKDILRQFDPNSRCDVRPNLGLVEPGTPTEPVGIFQNFQRVNATQPATPTGNFQNFQKLDFNQPSFPTENVENSEAAELDQVITIFQKSKPIDPSEIPRWFPPKVKGILKCPTCPDALAYKASQFSILISSALILNSPSTSSPITATGLDNCISIDGSDTVKPPTTNTS
jgi:hypothetical protein